MKCVSCIFMMAGLIFIAFGLGPCFRTNVPTSSQIYMDSDADDRVITQDKHILVEMLIGAVLLAVANYFWEFKARGKVKSRES